MLMINVIIRKDRCKSCEQCVYACPKKILAIARDEIPNKMGYHTAKIINPESCIGCASCARMCPDGAITIERS